MALLPSYFDLRSSAISLSHACGIASSRPCLRYFPWVDYAAKMKTLSSTLRSLGFQERALDATRERLQSELGEMALKRSTLINGNFREMPPELEPMSVQLVV